MVPNVSPDIKTRPFIRILQCGEHLKKIFATNLLPWNPAHASIALGKLSQHFRRVIRHITIVDVGFLQHVSNYDVKIKSVRNPQTSPVLNQRMKKLLVIQNHVASLIISKQVQQNMMVPALLVERRGNEIQVIRGELNPAIWLN